MAGQLVWLENQVVEEPFLRNLFRDLPLQDGAGDADVIIYSGIQREPKTELLDFLQGEARSSRVLFHLSDEKLRHRNRIYSQFDLVVRNYFDPRLAWRKNVVFFPLGWTDAFGGDVVPLDAPKTYLWSFCGAEKVSREKLVDAFSSLAGGFLHLTSGWNSDDQLAPTEVKNVYSESTFVLCPAGNAHFDTFRIMEALQAGAIPVVVKFLGRDFAKYTFGEHPFLVANSWHDAATLIQKASASPSQLQEWQVSVRAWYLAYVAGLEEKVRQILLSPNSAEAKRPLTSQSQRARFDLALILAVTQRFGRYRR